MPRNQLTNGSVSNWLYDHLKSVFPPGFSELSAMALSEALAPAVGELIINQRRLAELPFAEMLYECIRELSYVQSVENCHSGLCASAKGKELIEQGMYILGISNLSAEHLIPSPEEPVDAGRPAQEEMRPPASPKAAS